MKPRITKARRAAWAKRAATPKRLTAEAYAARVIAKTKQLAREIVSQAKEHA